MHERMHVRGEAKITYTILWHKCDMCNIVAHFVARTFSMSIYAHARACMRVCISQLHKCRGVIELSSPAGMLSSHSIDDSSCLDKSVEVYMMTHASNKQRVGSVTSHVCVCVCVCVCHMHEIHLNLNSKLQ